VNYLVKSEAPKNIFCTWTINPNSVIQNEEHLTASFEDRVASARKVADKGIRVGFHFHPMVYYKGWKEEYQNVIEKITSLFTPEEVVFVSFGTLTFPKPIIKKIRNYNIKSKILQMPMVSNPEGKLTYPDEIKEQLFSWGYSCFSAWHKNVFFYLCMEEEKYWTSTFGEVFSSNKAFEEALLESASEKMGVQV
jgi:spore photoproduct lyase